MLESVIEIPGFEIPGYKIEREIGRGGMATVYLAVQQSLHRKVALKVMNPLLSVDEDFRRRFLNEAHIVGQLSHSHIVTVFDVGSHENRYYLSMDYLPGGSLRDQINEGLSLERALDIAKTLARALGYAHQRGFIHRDIKPANVLFREDGFPVLTDFGIARAIGTSSQLTRTGYAFGSVGYMSPEQSLGKKIDHRSDIYSFGVILWEMLTGQRLYESEDAFSLALKHATAPIPPILPELQLFEPLLKRLLAKQPEERFDRLEDFLAELESLQQDTDTGMAVSVTDSTVAVPRDAREPHTFVIPAASPGSAVSSRSPSRSRRKRTIGASVVLVSVIGVGILFLMPGMNPLQPEPVSVQTTEISKSLGSDSPISAEVDKVEPKPSTGVEPVMAESDVAARVQQWLNQADAQWRAGQFMEPAGDNAFNSYRQALILDPNNSKARERLLEIGRMRLGGQYQERAQRLLDQGELEQSFSEIQQGLRLAPEYDGLLELKQRLEDRLAAAEVAALLARAERQWQQGQYTEPPGDNAYETYRQVLALKPDNDQARTRLIDLGRRRLVEQFRHKAEKLIAEGKLQQGLGEIEKGLRLAPENADLLVLRRQLQARLDTDGQ